MTRWSRTHLNANSFERITLIVRSLWPNGRLEIPELNIMPMPSELTSRLESFRRMNIKPASHTRPQQNCYAVWTSFAACLDIATHEQPYQTQTCTRERVRR